MGRFSTIFLFFVLLLTISTPAFPASRSKQEVRLRTVVIDAGHGGHDPGATNGRVYEKNITLSVAKSLGALINQHYPEIKVIYTRDSDKFVELYKRADIANKNNADLFISIHVNSASNRNARGHETFVMGQAMSKSNMEVCRLENSVIVLEEDYTSNYQGYDPDNPESHIIFTLLQNSHLEQSLNFATLVQQHANKGPVPNNRGVKQDNFIVLWKCTMPAVLIELGFISNASDLKILTDKNSLQRMAQNIFKAFEAYKKSYDTEVFTEAATEQTPETVIEPGPQAASQGRYGIQIMVLTKALPSDSREFKGLQCHYIKSGNNYKYYTGPYSSRNEAQKDLTAIRKLFPGSFIIELNHTP